MTARILNNHVPQSVQPSEMLSERWGPGNVNEYHSILGDLVTPKIIEDDLLAKEVDVVPHISKFLAITIV